METSLLICIMNICIKGTQRLPKWNSKFKWRIASRFVPLFNGPKMLYIGCQ